MLLKSLSFSRKSSGIQRTRKISKWMEKDNQYMSTLGWQEMLALFNNDFKAAIIKKKCQWALGINENIINNNKK